MTHSLIIAACLFAPVTFGQSLDSISRTPDSGQRATVTVISMNDRDSSAVRVVTRVPFQGMDYFIAIVPIDSSFSNRMPVYNPYHDPRRSFAPQDSLRLMPADSILRLLPRREDFLKPRKPVRSH